MKFVEGTWWYCEDCGHIFMYEDSHFERVENRHWWLDDCPVETWVERYCPECGSADIEEAEYCDYCGEVFKPGDLVYGVCDKCRKEIEEYETNSEGSKTSDPSEGE